MPELVHCIYTSVQSRVLTPGEIDELIAQSRANNYRHNLSGILLHVGQTFFQVLEGAPDTIRDLYNKILHDPRHTRITQIIFEAIPRRYFEEYSMTLATLSTRELAQLLDEVNPEVTEHLLSGLDEGRAKRLLRAFAQGRWRARLNSGLNLSLAQTSPEGLVTG